jgi:UDP-glucose:(heptosyl)LPS alpha-1,3-glucosyltransferase
MTTAPLKVLKKMLTIKNQWAFRSRMTTAPLKVKISLIRRGYSPTGGAENYLKRLGRSLSELNHEITLYTTPDWPKTEWPYGELVALNTTTPRAFARAVQKQCSGTLFSLERIYECDCYRAGDGVHKLWLQHRTHHEPPWKSWFRRINPKHTQILALEKSLIGNQGAKHIIANSNLVKKEILAAYRYPEQKISVIYNGIPDLPAPSQTRAETRRKLNLANHHIALLFVGSGWKRKGLNYAIEAVAPFKDVILLVAGSDKNQHPPHSNRIRFLGPVKEIQELYQAADLFVLPTLYDPFSNACLEALTAGLPVITTATNGFSEIITPGIHGEIIDTPQNIDALSTAIGKWCDKERFTHARNACVTRGKSFPMETNVQKTIEVLSNLSANTH